MNIAIFDQNHFYANGLKVLINELLSQGANITINESSLLSKAHLVIRTPALSSWEEWQSAFNHPQTLYIYHRPLPTDPLRRGNALYRGEPLGITLNTLKQHLHRCPDEEIPPPSINRLLSDNEIQVLKLIKMGWSDRVIAAHCRLGTKTVSLMRCNAIKKMGLHNRLELYQLLSKLHF
ncbi:helix-turn-helix domain-containing protein [Serratia sp. T13T92]|jgi:DNA-binding CsgD family transcriptional regulator|uniref:helix-turn-helix domain-containing protein n=1 Tax=Serratia sp. T13T92 TaxID=3397496 RepID=UPI0039DF3103